MSDKQRYRVLVGITYDEDRKRAEPGAIVDDIPAKSIGWLVKQRIIEPVPEPARPAKGAKGEGQ